MAIEVNVKDTTRAMAYTLWMKAPNPGLSRKVCKFIYESWNSNVAHSWG